MSLVIVSNTNIVYSIVIMSNIQNLYPTASGSLSMSFGSGFAQSRLLLSPKKFRYETIYLRLNFCVFCLVLDNDLLLVGY